jgi:protein disulfide-isomerase A1
LPIYEKLAKELEPNTNLVLAKMDATENEIPNIVIPAYPTIKFYKRVDEKLKIISYYGDKTA